MKIKQEIVVQDSGLLPLSRLPWSGNTTIHYDEKSPWVADILSELAEDVGDEIAMVGDENIGLSMDFILEKKRHPQFGEILIVEGRLASRFPTVCSQTGAVMVDFVEADINACFLHENLKKQADDPMEEEIDIALGDRVYDLYFYAPKGAQIKEMVHEYIFLNKNPYPRLTSTE